MTAKDKYSFPAKPGDDKLEFAQGQGFWMYLGADGFVARGRVSRNGVKVGWAALGRAFGACKTPGKYCPTCGCDYCSRKRRERKARAKSQMTTT